MQISNLPNFVNYLLYPLKAIGSKNFYYQVMFDLRGVGLRYMFFLCAAIALPATFQVRTALDTLKGFELSTVVAQIPPSYISPEGILSPDNERDSKLQIIYNSKKEAILAYNLENEPLPNNQYTPLTLTKDSLLINTQDGLIALPWQSLYGNAGAKFEPLEASKMMEEAFNSSYASIWLIVTLWIFSSIAFIILIAALITKVASTAILKFRMGFARALRLCSFGATVVALMLLLQFFFSITVSYFILCLVPVIYVMSFMAAMRRTIYHSLLDIDYALNPLNPFKEFFDYVSRFNEDGYYDRGPELSVLDKEHKDRRMANLGRNLFGQFEYTVYRFAEWRAYQAGLTSRPRFSNQVNDGYGDISNDPNYYENQNFDREFGDADEQGFHSKQSYENNNQGFEAQEPKQDSAQGYNEPNTAEQSHNAENQESQREDSPKPNPYAFNAKRDDDVFGGDEPDDVPERGEVRRGSKGDDSSFVP